MRTIMLPLCFSLALLGACGSTSGNSGGSGGSGGHAGTTGVTSTSTSTTSGTSTGAGADCAGIDASFAAVLAKPLSGCAGFEPPCHNAGAGQLKFVPSDAAGTYAALVNVDATVAGAGKRVVPGDPEHSFLYRKLTDMLTATEGGPMPQPSGISGPTGGGPAMWMELPQDEIDTVRCWIAAGAKKN